MDKEQKKCNHNNTIWAPLHDCHYCPECMKWVDYDYKLKKYRVYTDGKWILDDEPCASLNES